MERSARGAWLAVNDLVVRYALKFGAVGLIGYGIDIGLFNALRVGHGGGEPIIASSFTAKMLSVSLATLVTWFGNRYWTFRDRRRHDFALELLEFSAIAAFGMGIALACLYISRSVLGFESLLADNVAANVVGLGLATTFRFLMYRYWVYGDHRSVGSAAGVTLGRTAPDPDLPSDSAGLEGASERVAQA